MLVNSRHLISVELSNCSACHAACGSLIKAFNEGIDLDEQFENEDLGFDHLEK